MIKLTACYRREIRILKEEEKRNLIAVEMNYLRSSRIAKLQHIMNE